MIQLVINTHQNVRIRKFGDVPVWHSFFDSFREYYEPYYSEWVAKKRLDPVYIVEERGNPIAFMKLKNEYENEDYSDISPTFEPDKRMKISSFKVERGNYGLSIQLMDMAISEAIFNNMSEVYGTIPKECHYKYDLINFLHRYGFKKHGIKESHGLVEEVYVKRLKESKQ